MASQYPAAILGLGSYAPTKRLTNQDFEKTLDTTDEWITSRTGIKARHIAAPGQQTSDLCVLAAQKALEDARMKADEIDLIIVATSTPDYPFPATACILQNKLGISEKKMPAFDIAAACTGFMYALSTATAYVRGGMAKRVLVVGAEEISRIMDYQDRSVCILFGDGAGAVVVGAPEAGRNQLIVDDIRMGADGRGSGDIIMHGGGCVNPATQATLDERMHYMKVNGREVFRFAVTILVDMLKEAMDVHQLKPEQIGLIIQHQANIRILESACERLGLSMDMFALNLAEYGNTSAASIPLAWDEARRDGRIPAGKPVILLAFGGGLTWSWAVLK